MMSSISKQVILLSLLFAPTLASINLPKHVAVRESSAMSIKRMSASTSVTSASSRNAVTRSPLLKASRGRHSTTAFVDPGTIISTIGAFYQNQPYTSSFLTCAVKGIAADLVAQKQAASQQERELVAKSSKRPFMRRGGAAVSSSIDLKRNFAFLLYSGLYQGMALNLIYNTVIPNLVGNGVIKNVLFSMFVVSPFLTLPIAYLFKALVFSQSPMVAMQQYWSDIRYQSLLKIYWTIWIPVQTVAFSVVPQHLRISFIAAVSFLWMIIFSSIQAK